MSEQILPAWKSVKKVCLQCGKPLRLIARRDLERKKFCSRGCRTRFYPAGFKGKRHQEEVKSALALRRKEEGRFSGVKNPNAGGKLSRGRPASDRQREIVRQRMRAGGAAWARKHCGGKKSSLQQIVEDYLTSQGVRFEPEKIVGRHAVDIFVAPNCCIECDGTYWHSLPEQQERDREFASFCRKAGFRLIRLPEADIRSGRFQSSLSHLMPV